MTIFAVMAQNNNDAALGAAVVGAFPQNYVVGPGQWLISVADINPQEVATRLGAEQGARGKVLVVTVSNYWGFHDTNLWAWLKAQTSSAP
jgi:hypothetical protein